ncbi:MAG: peptidoglycan-binding protein [Parcubacteria group bacterium]|nr:peptidoglycan-binding protein [Parcubacteria group bacterium]
MFKKWAVIGVVLAFLVPLATSASVLSEMRARLEQQRAAQAAQAVGGVGGNTSTFSNFQNPQPVPVPPVNPSKPNTPNTLPDDYPTAGEEKPACPTLTVLLKRGSRDATSKNQVTELQLFLAEHFGLNEEDVVTGYFGKTTASYVVRFQQEQGLPAFGIAGSMTRAAIARVCGGQATPTPSGGAHITLVSPNGGETYNIGDSLQLVWSGKNFPAGSQVCGTLTTAAGGSFAFPPTGSCRDVGGGSGGSTHKGILAGTLIQNPGYNLATGRYTAKITLLGPSTNPERDRPTLAVDTSDTPIVIGGGQTTPSPNNTIFIPSTTLGVAPLQVKFHIPSSEGSFVDFGDGTDNVICTDKAGESCSVSGITHTYNNPGVYTAKLYQSVYRCTTGGVGKDGLPDSGCGYQKTSVILSTAQITVTSSTQGPGLTVKATLEDPTGNGKEAFAFGDQLVIKWSVDPISDLELVGWNGYAPDTGIELRPYNNPTAAGIRIARVKESGVFPHTFTWNVAKEGLYGDVVTSGKYYVYVTVASKQQGGYRVGVAGAVWLGVIPPTPPSTGITVTAPNGGERWEQGVMNTVTWAPYSYTPTVQNPSSDVTAYLERWSLLRGYTTVGKVEASGKASIHWITGELDSATMGGNFVPPGEYYIRVVNNVTGATDRSDKSFTIAPKPIDLKINGSDGPVVINSATDPVTVSWSSPSTSGVHTCQLTSVDQLPWSNVVASSGSISSRLSFGTNTSTTVYIQCIVTNTSGMGAQVTDYVQVTAGTPQAPVLQVISPNGGEQLVVDKPFTLKFKTAGISQMSIALYKNEQWIKWIGEAAGFNGTEGEVNGYRQWEFNPSVTLGPAEASSLPSAGNVYKIYVTGQKADGTGYIDDKSDAPFSFVSGTQSSCTLDGVTLSNGEQAMFYSQKTVAVGKMCGDFGQVRTCNNGVLSGSATYQYATCTEQTVTARSPWGKKLAVAAADIPDGRFRLHVFKRDTTGAPSTALRSPIVLDQPYLTYINFEGGYQQPLSKQIGGYFVGRFAYPANQSIPVTFDFSNPQWDIARLYIDGVLAHTYGNNTGSPTFTKTFTGGTHIIEIEYDSRWHAGTFALRMGLLINPGYTTSANVTTALKALKTQYPDLKVLAAAAYISNDQVNGDITVNLPTINSPAVLVLSSYDPVRWRWVHNQAAVNQIKAIVVHSLAGAAVPDFVGSIPTYLVREYISRDAGNQGITAKIGLPIDSYSSEYSGSTITLPAILPPPTALPEIVTFTTSSNSIPLGGSVTVSWQSKNAVRCVFYSPASVERNVPDDVPLSGSKTLVFGQTTSDFNQGKVASLNLTCLGSTLNSAGNTVSASKDLTITLTAPTATTTASNTSPSSQFANVLTPFFSAIQAIFGFNR